MFGALGRGSLILSPHLHGRLCSRNRWREYQILIHSLWIYDKCLNELQVSVIRSLNSKVAKFSRKTCWLSKKKCQDSKMRFLFSVLTVWSVRISDLGQRLALATWHYLECLSTIQGRAIVWIIHLQKEAAVMTCKMIGLTGLAFFGQWARLQAAIQMSSCLKWNGTSQRNYKRPLFFWDPIIQRCYLHALQLHPAWYITPALAIADGNDEETGARRCYDDHRVQAWL